MTPPVAVPNLLPEKFIGTGESVVDFYYLGDALGLAGVCADAATVRVRYAWKSFHRLLPLHTNCGINLAVRGNIFAKCTRMVLLHGSQTWPLSVDDLYRLKRCDHVMLRWICVVKLTQPHSTAELRSELKTAYIRRRAQMQ